MEYSTLKQANPWWEKKDLINKDIHLTKLKDSKIHWKYEVIKSFKEGIYSLRGPRQVGKTTWIKQKIKELLEQTNPQNIFFYSCDDIENFKELIELIRLFLDLSDENKRKYIFLDEIPYVEDWQKAIKHLYDSGEFKKCSIILSGSCSIDIKKNVEQLPGRGDEGKKHFVFLPLTFNEYLKAIGRDINITGNLKKDIALTKLNLKLLNKEYSNYLLTGGFLKVINEFLNTNTISDSTYDVYLKWIIGDLAKWNLRVNFSKQLMRRIIETYTSELSWSTLKSGTEVESHHTVSKYVNTIEEMFVFNVLYKMDFNKKLPDFPRSKKIYFSDPFILSACYKLIYNKEDNFNNYKKYLEDNIDKISEGVLLNHLINIIYKQIKSNIYDYKDLIYYWTNKSKTKEIDFIYNNIALELKFKESIKSSDYKSLNEFEKSFLITKKTFDKRTFPISTFLILLEKHFGKFLH